MSGSVSTIFSLCFEPRWRHLWLLLVGRCLCQVFADKGTEGAWNSRRRTSNRRGVDDGDETTAMSTEETDGGAEATSVPGEIVCSEQCSLSICMCGCCSWLSYGFGLEVKSECCWHVWNWKLNVVVSVNSECCWHECCSFCDPDFWMLAWMLCDAECWLS